MTAPWTILLELFCIVWCSGSSVRKESVQLDCWIQLVGLIPRAGIIVSCSAIIDQRGAR